jgi:hypothetical protein
VSLIWWLRGEGLSGRQLHSFSVGTPDEAKALPYKNIAIADAKKAAASNLQFSNRVSALTRGNIDKLKGN